MGGSRGALSSQRWPARCWLCARLRCSTSQGGRWLCQGDAGLMSGEVGAQRRQQDPKPTPTVHPPQPSPGPGILPCSLRPGRPRCQALQLEPLQRAAPGQPLPVPESQLSHGWGLPGGEERGWGRAEPTTHLSSSTICFLMALMRSLRLRASSWRRRPSSKVEMRSCTCFCWLSRTWRRSSSACCRRPAAFLSASSRSFSICSLWALERGPRVNGLSWPSLREALRGGEPPADGLRRPRGSTLPPALDTWGAGSEGLLRGFLLYGRCMKFFVTFAQGPPQPHFALSPANDVAGPAPRGFTHWKPRILPVSVATHSSCPSLPSSCAWTLTSGGRRLMETTWAQKDSDGRHLRLRGNEVTGHLSHCLLRDIENRTYTHRRLCSPGSLTPQQRPREHGLGSLPPSSKRHHTRVSAPLPAPPFHPVRGP